MLCDRCGIFLEYYGNGRPRKYCKVCAIIMNRIKTRKRMERRRNLGTSDFFEHKKQKSEHEYAEIQAEIKRLGFKRQFT